MSPMLRGSERSADGRAFRDRFLDAGQVLGGGRPTAAAAYGGLVVDLLGERTHELFLVERGGNVEARAAVAASTTAPDTVLLGLYEAADGESGDLATAELVESAEAWARAQGREKLVAPVDGSTWMAYRFRDPSLDEGARAAERAYGWEPLHPERYLQRFRDAGYVDVLEFQTLGMIFPSGAGYTVTDASRQIRTAAVAASSAGYTFQVLRDHHDEVPWVELHALCSECFAENPLFEPLPLPVFRRLFEGALGSAASDFTHWLRDPDGQMCAVVFAFREGDAVVVKSIAVSPAHRSRHLSTALIHHVLEEASAVGVDEIISALVRSGNASEFLSRRHLLPGTETWSHGFTVLGKELDR